MYSESLRVPWTEGCDILRSMNINCHDPCKCVLLACSVWLWEISKSARLILVLIVLLMKLKLRWREELCAAIFTRKHHINRIHQASVKHHDQLRSPIGNLAAMSVTSACLSIVRAGNNIERYHLPLYLRRRQVSGGFWPSMPEILLTVSLRFDQFRSLLYLLLAFLQRSIITVKGLQ